jgi:PST family polysaccharide transporter
MQPDVAPPPAPAPAPAASPVAPPPRGGVRSAVFWSYALTAGRVGTTTVVTFVLARLLGPAEFGVLAMALLILLLAETVLQQSAVTAIVQREQLTEDHLDAAFLAMLLGGIGLGALMAAVGPLWAMATREPQLTTVCLALAPVVLLHALMTVPEAVLRRALRFRALAVRTVAAAVVSGAVGIALALAGAGVWALVAQQIVGSATNLVIVWLVSDWRPRRRPRIGAIRDLWRFSAHSANAGVALLLSRRADQFVIGLTFGSVAMGIYRLAGRLPEMFVEVTVRSLQQVALPALSRLQDDRAAFAARLAGLQHLGAVAGLPLLGVLAGAAEALVAVLGPQWAGTELPLRLLCLYAAVNVYGVLLGPALQATGHPGRLAAIAWLRGVIGVAVFVAVGLAAAGRAPVTQAASIALAAVVVQAVLNAVAVQLTRRTIGAANLRLIGPTLPAMVAALVAVAVPLLLDRLGLVVDPPLLRLVVDGGLAALAGGAALWAVDRRLRRMVRERLRRSRR